MFQVASHAVNVPFGPVSTPMAQQFSSPSPVSLPRTLTRPQFRDPSRGAIAAIEPELANVPIDYIRRGLRDMGDTMCSAVNNIMPMLPRSVPASHRINLNMPPASQNNRLPTHVLALSASKSSTDTPLLYPTHALLMAVYCTSLPTLPPNAPNSTSIPILPLTVSSPTLFPLLQNFLLTKRHDMLLSSLFQIAPSTLSCLANVAPNVRSSTLAHILIQHTKSSMPHLLSYTTQLTAFWKLICALGVFDDDTWETLDLAWEASLGAMNLAVSREENTRGRRM